MTYEDCIEVLAGLQSNIYSSQEKFNIEKSDVSLIYSLGRQTLRGIPFTDRQLDLVKNKIAFYKNHLENVEIDKLTLRMPLRSINREKYVKIIKETHGPIIRIRFPFSKKLIVEIEKLKEYANGYRKNSTHEHDFDINEIIVYKIVKAFEKKQFDIDKELIEYSRKVETIIDEKEKYVPGIYNFDIKNVPENTINYITTNYGTPDNDNLYIFKDRRYVLGLDNFDNNIIKENYKSLTPLTVKIVERTKSNVFINSNNYKLSNVVESLFELNRFPLLIVLPEQDSFDHLNNCYNVFSNIVDNKDCSVMYRLNNTSRDPQLFNIFVKEKQLNNQVAKNTKIVYISGNKITKPLVQSNFRAEAVLCMYSSRHNNKVQSYLDGHDLVIHYDTDKSPIMQFGAGVRRNNFTTSIEEL